MIAYVMILGGLLGLFLGGDWLVRGAVSIARRLAMPPLLIGLTVVGFGTSTPELLVSARAALGGVPDIALGNVVGSNIANVLLIIGLTALIRPIVVMGATLRRDTAVMMAAGVLLVPAFAMGEVGRLFGLLLLAGLVVYLVTAYRTSDPGERAGDVPLEPAAPVWQAIAWLGSGLAALLLGAQFLVDGSVSVARGFGVSEAFIGLTIVAVGTSLPELATSLIAAFRGQSQIAIGNVVGSNIFNILGILGVTAAIAPIPVASRFLTFDLPLMLAAMLALVALLLTRPVIGRPFGAAMLAAYVAFILTAQ